MNEPASQCAECERLREEIAEYMGHRTDNIAGKIWAARHLLSRFEDALEEVVGEFEGIGHDDYDQSLEIYGAPENTRLSEAAQRLIRDAGFGKVYLNHGPKGKLGEDGGRWETHYTFHDQELPVRGWRRRYVSDPASKHDRVIMGNPDPGYWEISYWPEGWNTERCKAELANGYYRIVPDPLEDMTLPSLTNETEG